MDWIDLEGPLGSSCGHGNELSCYIKCHEVLE
jgi:hypothetical protein